MRKSYYKLVGLATRGIIRYFQGMKINLYKLVGLATRGIKRYFQLTCRNKK
jgi:hypothetical protein